jgi:hypothetical protein
MVTCEHEAFKCTDECARKEPTPAPTQLQTEAPTPFAGKPEDFPYTCVSW